MTQYERDDAIARLLEARARGVTDPSLHELSEEDRSEVESLMEIADLLWEAGHGAPPLESDPVAAMLGLVPDPQFTLDPKALRRTRMSAGLKASELAHRLAARGWDVDRRDVFRWESRSATDVSPALIEAIADQTGTTADRLTASRGSLPLSESVVPVIHTPRFQGLVERWARIQGVSPRLAASALESRMLATVHRGDHPDVEQLLRSLEALVKAIEAGGDSRREP
jgi:transcriptional regulator with XRE-family HTH domain